MATASPAEEDTALLLLQAAEELFHRKGYEAVSTREIASAAEVNLAAIRYHFGSKEMLFHAVVKRLMARSIELRELLDSRELTPEKMSFPDAAELLRDFVLRFLQRILDESQPQGCRLMLRESASISAGRKELVEELVKETTEEFIRPLMKQLASLMSVLIHHSLKRSQASHSEASMAPNPIFFAQSVLAQCFFYSSHRLFIEHLDGRAIDVHRDAEELAQHISEFSLCAIHGMCSRTEKEK